MARTLKVGERDLSQYMVVEHEGGLDPANPEYSEPQFSGSPAFSEGKAFVGDANDNRLMSFPLILKASTVDGLYQLVREVNLELNRGMTVEFRSSNASASTFFDLETGRLEPKFEYWIDQAAKVRAMLHLWVRPFGHTGTTRVVATVAAVGGPQLITATGIVGDTPAQANLYAQASLFSNESLKVLYGIKSPAPSGWSPIATAAGLVGGETTASVVGASGRVASNYAGYAVNLGTSGAQGLRTIVFRPQDYGRYRVIADVKCMVHSSTAAASMFLRGSLGVSAGTVSLATSFQKFELLDLGEITVPTTSPTPKYELLFRGASGASAIATYPLQIDTVVFLPLDTSAGILLGQAPPIPSTIWRADFRGVQREVMRTATGGTPVTSDLAESFRGDFPSIPPVGTSAPSGPAQVVIWAPINSGTDVTGNRPADYGIAARERFSYLR